MDGERKEPYTVRRRQFGLAMNEFEERSRKPSIPSARKRSTHAAVFVTLNWRRSGFKATVVPKIESVIATETAFSLINLDLHPEY